MHGMIANAKTSSVLDAMSYLLHIFYCAFTVILLRLSNLLFCHIFAPLVLLKSFI